MAHPESHGLDRGVFVDFKLVKQTVSMLQILDYYGITASLKQSGENMSGPCPLHEGHNPTQFRVSLAKNCWNCFGNCKCGGNVLDFVAKKEKVGVREAAIMIQKWFAIRSPKPTRPATSTSASPQKCDSPPARSETKPPPSKPESRAKQEPVVEVTENKPLKFSLSKLKQDHPYFTQRGVTPESVREFGLGYCEKGLMAGRICIPIHNIKGELVAYAGRLPDSGTQSPDSPKYKLPSGFRKSLEVFNLHRAMASVSARPLVIVEGFFDCIRLTQAGYTNVAAIMGSTLSAEQAALITKSCEKSGQVILMFDGDAAGQEGMKAALVTLAKSLFVQTVVLGDGRQPDQLSPEEIHELLM